MTEYVNLTPHAVNVIPDDGERADYLASGTVARIREVVSRGSSGTIVLLAEIEDLPEPRDGVIFIVSMPVVMTLAAQGNLRGDVRYPYGQVRDAAGRIVGCRELARLGYWSNLGDPGLSPGDWRVIRRALTEQGTAGSVEYALADRLAGR